MPAFASAQNDASNTTKPKKTSHTSAHTSDRTPKTSAEKTKHPATHAATKRTSSNASVHSSSHKSRTHGKKTAKKRGQQAIDGDRARAIQQALIREHYMQGEPSGTWDAATQAAMQRYQTDQGWQAKTTPDSRALIKLGLGPSHDHLLNPESAMTTSPAPADPKPAAKPDPAGNSVPQQ